MLNIGPAEVLVIALIALIVVGPEQLPGVLRKVGKSAGQLRKMADGLKNDFMSGMDELDPNSWVADKPRGKGTTTDPIIGPGAYGPPPKTETEPKPEVADEKPQSDDGPEEHVAPETMDQPVTTPKPEPEIESVEGDEAQ
jgi:sec-independent protein translocase protein TatB